MKTKTIDKSKNENWYEECMELIKQGYHIAYSSFGIIILHF